VISWKDTNGRLWSPLQHQKKSLSRWIENGYRLRCLHQTGSGKTYVFLFCYLYLYYTLNYFPKGIIVCTRTLEKTTWTPLLKLWGIDKYLKVDTYQKIHNSPEILKDKEFIAIDEDHYLGTYKAKMVKTFLEHSMDIPYKITGTGTQEKGGIGDYFFSMKFLTGHDYSADKWMRSWGARYNLSLHKYLCSRENLEKMLYFYEPLMETVFLSDVMELPKFKDISVEMNLPKEQREAYDTFAYRDEYQLHALQDLPAQVILRLICSDVLPENEPTIKGKGQMHYKTKKVWDTKINKILDIVKKEDLPIIIWSRFRSFSDKLFHVLSETYRVQLWAGGTEKDLDKFDRGETDIVVASHQSVAEGMNLQRSHVAIFAHPDFDPTKYVQARYRIFRIGQKQLVKYYHLIYKDTIEEKIFKVLHGKQKNQKKSLKKIAKIEAEKNKRKLLSDFNKK